MRTFIAFLAVVVIVSLGAAVMLDVVTFTTHRESNAWSVTVTFHSIALPRGNTVEAAETNLLDIKGKVTATDAEKKELVVSENVTNWVFRLTPTSKLFLNNRECNLLEIRPCDEATVTFNRQSQELIASVVHCTRR